MTGVERMFFAGANIRMLAQSSRGRRVNFRKFRSGRGDDLDAVRARFGEKLDVASAVALGLVTMVLDEIDFEDKLPTVLEERASLSPNSRTHMEASAGFVGPETIETKVFGRLTAWQNWIFIRPNASGPDGALRRFGSGRKGDYDFERV
jgi:benzoyl-CoA-dihydrodiol lyase